MSKLTAALALLLAISGCAAVPMTSWNDALIDSHAFFQMGIEDLPTVPVPVSGWSGAGTGAASTGGGSTAPAVIPPATSSGGGGAAAPPPPTPAPAEVLSNTLDAGPGVIEGVVLDVVNGGTPVPETIITVVAAGDPTKQAVLRNGPDGRYRVADIALGTYLVIGEKPRHAAGTEAVEVILYPGSPEVKTVNLALSPP